MNRDLVKQAYEVYGLNRHRFSTITGISRTTLKKWEDKGLCKQSELLVNTLIKMKQQEIQHQKEIRKYEKNTRQLELKVETLNSLKNVFLQDIEIN